MDYKEEVFIYWKEKIEKENYNTFNYQPYTNQDRIDCIERYKNRLLKEVKNSKASDKQHRDFRRFSFKAFKRLIQRELERDTKTPNNTEGKLFI